MAWIAAVLLFCSVNSARSVDLTIQRDSMGADVVRAVLARLNEVDKVDRTTTSAEKQVMEQFIREMAYVETVDGTENSRDGGIWGVSRELFEQTQQYNFPELFNAISLAFCINWLDIQYSELRSPLHSALAVKVELFQLHSINQRLEGTATDEQRANYWMSYFDGTAVSQWLTRTQQLRNTEVCRVDTDVVFVVDSSGSIRSGNYQLVRNYLYAYTEGLLSSDSSSRVGVILFSSSAQVAIGLDFVTTSGQLALLGQIATLRYIGEGTNTPEGLCLLKTMSWRESASVLRVAVVLTDGRSTGSSSTCWQSGGTLSSTAAEVHSLQPPVTVFAVGVGNYNPAELNIIASSPLLVDELNSFDAQLLLQNQRSRTDSICFKETQPASIGQEQRGALRMDSVSRLRFTGSGGEGVTARICLDQGEIVVHGSSTYSTPNMALHDFSQEITAGNCRNFFASTSDINDARCTSNSNGVQVNETTLYLTIQGMSTTESQYSVNSSIGNAFGGCTVSLRSTTCGGVPSYVVPVVIAVVVMCLCVAGIAIITIVIKSLLKHAQIGNS